MVFESQFALTLELTKLLPLDLLPAGAKAAVAFARQLQNAGSDIVIEQDLAELFGRARIEAKLESSFRDVVSKSKPIFLTDEMMLAGAPGPTVGRALQERPYFATVVQLSLLCWIHETTSLAQAIVRVIEKKFAAAPPDQRMAPGQYAISKTLKACEEQTSAYNWSGLVQAVGATLGLGTSYFVDTINTTVLGGLMDMLPMLQQLPEDRMAYIAGGDGVCVVVVWAHHILGLTVLVKAPSGNMVQFGKGDEQVYIDASDPEPGIALYDCSGPLKEQLILVKPDLEDVKIGGFFKLPLKGFGAFQLKNLCEAHTVNTALFEEMVAVTIAIAMLLASKLLYASGRSHKSRQRDGEAILRTSKLLFYGAHVDTNTALSYVGLYTHRPIDARLPRPASLRALPTVNPQETWEELLFVCRSLSIVILCLSHVANLSEAESFPLPLHLVYFSSGGFWEAIQSWNGIEELPVREGLWFELLITLLSGNKTLRYAHQLSLYSNWGWSVLMSTFNDEDPEQQDVGELFIFNAVPSRNGVRKAGVVDGPSSSNFDVYPVTMRTADQVVRCELQTDVQRRRTLFGELDEFFSVSLSLACTTSDGRSKGEVQLRRVGYRELHQSLWSVSKTSNCQHAVSTSEIRLGSDMAAMADFYEEDIDRPSARVLIALTAGSKDARRRTLLALHHSSQEVEINDQETPLLRTAGCCIRCAVEQADAIAGKVTLVL